MDESSRESPAISRASRQTSRWGTLPCPTRNATPASFASTSCPGSARAADRSARSASAARVAGARKLGYSVYRIASGGRPYPFHFHHVNEEFFYVRRGYGQLRDKDGTRDLKPGDAFACPPGPNGAHAILNTGDAPLEIFALSTMEEPEVSEYLDSDKLYVIDRKSVV